MKSLLPLIGILSVLQSFSQEAKLEQSIFSAQVGLFGAYVNNEYAVSKKIALRSEIGYEFISLAYSDYLGFSYDMHPVITFEPRWYYNLERRAGRGKNISKNSANFISIKSSFNPNIFVSTTGSENITVISVIPTWGLRRKMGKHFNFETGFGIGGGYLFYEDLQYNDELYVTVNLHLRFGYNFFIGSK